MRYQWGYNPTRVTLAVFPARGMTVILPGKERNSYTAEEEKKPKRSKCVILYKS